MTYWLVMAIVVIALIAVVIAVGLEPDEPEVVDSETSERPIWVALGSSALMPPEHDRLEGQSWVDIVRDDCSGRLIAYDFTRFGATADEIQRESLDAALAAKPDIVTLLIGPDDFRDAEALNVFERRLWHILTSLTKVGALPILTTLPDLTALPSMAAEDDLTVLTDERTSWNVAIRRLSVAAAAELIEIEEVADSNGDLFSEASGRFFFTEVGHRWFASLMMSRMRSRLSDPMEANGESAAPDETSMTAPY